jgi:hypothetical protein
MPNTAIATSVSYNVNGLDGNAGDLMIIGALSRADVDFTSLTLVLDIGDIALAPWDDGATALTAPIRTTFTITSNTTTHSISTNTGGVVADPADGGAAVTTTYAAVGAARTITIDVTKTLAFADADFGDASDLFATVIVVLQMAPAGFIIPTTPAVGGNITLTTFEVTGTAGQLVPEGLTAGDVQKLHSNVCFHGTKCAFKILDGPAKIASDVRPGDELVAMPNPNCTVAAAKSFTVNDVIHTGRRQNGRWVVFDVGSLTAPDSESRPTEPMWVSPQHQVQHPTAKQHVAAITMARPKTRLPGVSIRTDDDSTIMYNFFVQKPPKFPHPFATVSCNGAPVRLRFAEEVAEVIETDVPSDAEEDVQA